MKFKQIKSTPLLNLLMLAIDKPIPYHAHPLKSGPCSPFLATISTYLSYVVLFFLLLMQHSSFLRSVPQISCLELCSSSACVTGPCCLYRSQPQDHVPLCPSVCLLSLLYYLLRCSGSSNTVRMLGQLGGRRLVLHPRSHRKH